MTNLEGVDERSTIKVNHLRLLIAQRKHYAEIGNSFNASDFGGIAVWWGAWIQTSDDFRCQITPVLEW